MDDEKQIEEENTNFFQLPSLPNYRKTGASLSFIPSLKQNRILHDTKVKPLLNFDDKAILPNVNGQKLEIDILSESISLNRICFKICRWFSMWNICQQKIFISSLVEKCSENVLVQLDSTLEPVYHHDFKIQLTHRRSKSSPIPNTIASRSTSGKSDINSYSDATMNSSEAQSSETLRNSLRSYDFRNSDYWTNEKYSSSQRPALTITKRLKSTSLRNTTHQDVATITKNSENEFKDQLKHVLKRIDHWSEGKTEVLLMTIAKEATPSVLQYLANCVNQRLDHRLNINCLTDKILLTIFSNLDPQSICRCAQTCQRWRYLTKDNSLWYSKCDELTDEVEAQDLMDVIEESAKEHDVSIDWKLAYQELLNIVNNNLTSEYSANISRESLFTEHYGIKFLEDINNTIEKEYANLRIFMAKFLTALLIDIHHEAECQTIADTRTEEDPYYDDDSIDSFHNLNLGTLAKVVHFTSKLANERNAVRSGIVRPLKHVFRLQGHLEAVMCLQFDKCKIISGSADRTLRLWDIRSGRPVKGGIRCLQYDDNIIVTGSWDATVRVWDIIQYKTLNILYKHRDCVSCLQFTEEKLIDNYHFDLSSVTGSYDSTLCVWNMKNWECKGVFKGHTDSVNCLHFDGRMVLSGSTDKTLLYWNCETLECLHRFTGHTDAVLSLEVRSGLAASGSADGKIMFWNLKHKFHEATVAIHKIPVRSIRFMGLRFFAGLDDGNIKEFDLRTGIYIRTLSGHFGPVQCLQIQKKRMISSSDDGSIRIWDMKEAPLQVGNKSYPRLLNKIVLPPNVITEELMELQFN
ncbi:uncharacterized protein TRIADDRAFT_57055 [Trichoplax adhaerens]|uniref:F-box domain-containing protein n=1 Tax=Trichoplax adhaerens TaxID=10228 RepID=B3S0I0_TRIAD|nr:hypothetical protein TRIADDRAFT_57055 [Trichoplax adhaerens]EDV23646.1 hypothetical protein TRIADDRAFT_57055 [Trichoplax adhaerens]|eukprot:XP_002113172.1 hypothetical protein TRIADDRAFT_57055 [Trichoplax adhaerens]